MSPSAPNVVGEELFKLILHLEIQKASRLRYCVSVISLSPDIPSGEFTPDLSSRIAEASVRSLRRTDIAAVLGNSSVALLLIDAETPTLQAVLDRTARSIEEVRVDTVGGIRRLSLSAGASSYPKTASTEDELLEQAEALMTRARKQGGDRLCLPA